MIFIYIYMIIISYIWCIIALGSFFCLNVKFSMIYKSLLGFMKSNTFTKNFNIFKVM